MEQTLRFVLRVAQVRGNEGVGEMRASDECFVLGGNNIAIPV